MVERATGAEAAPVASGGGDAARPERDRAERRSRSPGLGDGDAPGPVAGRSSLDGDVAAEVDERTRQAGPGLAHRVERPRGPEALADPAEVDGCARLEAGGASLAVELDRGPGAPAARGPGLALLELGEGAVVAGGDEGGEDGRVEAAAAVQPGAQRRLEGGEQTLADRRPSAVRCVQARQVAPRVEARERALA